MKNRIIAFSMAVCLLLTVSACANTSNTQANATTADASPIPTPVVSVNPTSSETPQVEDTRYAPTDLLGEDLNPLYEIAFPEDFLLEKVAVKAHDDGTTKYGIVYRMIFSAPSVQSAVAALMSTSGISLATTEDEACQSLQSAGVLTLTCGVLQDGSSFACDLLSGKDGSCTVEVYTEAPQEHLSRYAQFIEDNYCENMFGAIQLGLATIPSENVFPVNITISYEEDRAKTEFVTYYFADDVETFLKILVNGGGYDTYVSDSQYFLMDYGKAIGDVWVGGNGAVSVRQSFNGVPDTPLYNYEYVPSVTLETYGFSFDKEQGICQYESENGMGGSLAFHSSEWGDADVDWQVEFSFPLMGAILHMWYRPDNKRYDVFIEMDDGTTIEYAYDVENACYRDFTPDVDTASACLSWLFVNAESGDVFAQPFVLLERQSVSLAGVGFTQLTALAPTDLYDYTPLADQPALPSAGNTERASGAEQTSEEEPKDVGSASGNLFMGFNDSDAGFFAVQGEWLYFGDPIQQYLCKAKFQNGSDKQVLCEDAAAYINPVGDIVYYCNMWDDYSICSVGTDGLNQQKLADGHCEDLSYLDGWLYYYTADGIFKLSANGGNPEQLLSGKFRSTYAYEGWVYYLDDQTGDLCRITVDGGESEKLLSGDHILSYVIVDGGIYSLINTGESYNIILTKSDGSSRITVYSQADPIDAFNASQNRLFLLASFKNGVYNILTIWNMETNKIEQTNDDLFAPVVWCFGSNIVYLLADGVAKLSLNSGEQVMLFN